MDVIQAPDLVGGLGLEQVLLGPGRESLLGPAPDVQAHRRVDAVHPLVIPGPPSQTEPVEGLPEPNSWVLGHQRVQSVDDFAVVLRLSLVVVCALGQTHRFTALTDADAVLLSHVLYQLPLLARA
ncbi:MAG: hypothetical protein AAF970_09765 [Bacteroidota bacterium]